MTRFQIADHEKMPVGHVLLESKLAALPSRAHPIQDWGDAREMEYYERGSARTVTCDKLSSDSDRPGAGYQAIRRQRVARQPASADTTQSR